MDVHAIDDGFLNRIGKVTHHGLIRGIVLQLLHDRAVFSHLVGNGARVVEHISVGELTRKDVIQSGNDDRKKLQLLILEATSNKGIVVAPALDTTIILENKFGFKINPSIIPEFPVRKGSIYPDVSGNSSIKVDYLALSEDSSQAVFVELKTEGLSRRIEQDKNLIATKDAGLEVLVPFASAPEFQGVIFTKINPKLFSLFPIAAMYCFYGLATILP